MWIEYAGDLINIDRIVKIQTGLEGDRLGADAEIRFYVSEKDYFAYTSNSSGENVARVMRNIRRAINPNVDVALGRLQNSSLKDLEEWS